MILSLYHFSIPRSWDLRVCVRHRLTGWVWNNKEWRLRNKGQEVVESCGNLRSVRLISDGSPSIWKGQNRALDLIGKKERKSMFYTLKMRDKKHYQRGWMRTQVSFISTQQQENNQVSAYFLQCCRNPFAFTFWRLVINFWYPVLHLTCLLESFTHIFWVACCTEVT